MHLSHAASRALIPPNAAGIGANQDRRGCVLRASISILVIGFALAGSIGSSAAQYPPPHPPPPPPYSYPASRPRYPVYPYSGSPPPQDYGTVVAALPPEYQPERG